MQILTNFVTSRLNRCNSYSALLPRISACHCYVVAVQSSYCQQG